MNDQRFRETACSAGNSGRMLASLVLAVCYLLTGNLPGQVTIRPSLPAWVEEVPVDLTPPERPAEISGGYYTLLRDVQECHPQKTRYVHLA
ncbi:MAG TPA: hypothetical protein VMY18_10280, partial [Acidobacteriota bacterium]|nr:hypothetical protein [Acidobacteriota bacterium]